MYAFAGNCTNGATKVWTSFRFEVHEGKNQAWDLVEKTVINIVSKTLFLVLRG